MLCSRVVFMCDILETVEGVGIELQGEKPVIPLDAG